MTTNVPNSAEKGADAIVDSSAWLAGRRARRAHLSGTFGNRLTPCTSPLYAKRKGRESGSGCGDVGRSLADRSCGQLFRECYRML